MKNWIAGFLLAVISGVAIYWLTVGLEKPGVSANMLSVSIISPLNNSVVDVHDRITGSVTNSNARVWIVIQPEQAPDCWVQKPVIVNNDGTWTSSVQYGENTPDHSGSTYEVRALANPRVSLNPGSMTCWPDAQAISKALFVKRR